MKTFGKVWLGIGLLAIVFGFGILMLGVGSGANWRDIPTYSMDESYDGINSLDIKIAYGKVNIVEGNEFHIKADHLPDDSLKAYVTDGTWIVKESQNNFMDLLGLKLSVGQLVWWKNDLQPEITITVPRGFIANDFKFDISAGSAEIEAVRPIPDRFR